VADNKTTESYEELERSENRTRWLLEGRDTFIVEKGLWGEFVDWLAKRDGGERADAKRSNTND
jgi:hypothetical protein